MDQYYSVQKFLLNQFDRSEKEFSFSAVNEIEYVHWKESFREKLSQVTGLYKIKKSKYSVEELESVDCGAYTRKKILLQTNDWLFMPTYILIPKEGNNGIPVLAIHGHGSNGKEAVAGADSYNTEKYHHNYGEEFAKEGYIVFCPDLCGSGERREREQRGTDHIAHSSCNDINFAAIAMGLSMTAIHLNDLISLIDYIKDDPLCKSDELACCGFSGGGLQTLWLAAMDERITLAAVSGYYHGLRDTVLDNNFCGCNFVPGLWGLCDISDIASLIAPRKLYIESGIKDPLNGQNGMDNVYPFVERLKSAYSIYEGAVFEHYTFDKGHEWSKNAVRYVNEAINL